MINGRKPVIRMSSSVDSSLPLGLPVTASIGRKMHTVTSDPGDLLGLTRAY